MRLFVGIGMPEEAWEGLKPVLDQLKSAKGVRVPSPEQLHITLKFLGDVDENDLARIRDSLKSVSHPSFQITLSGIGGFPKLSRPRIVFAGVRESAFLGDLAKKVDAATNHVPLDRPFHPHVTIARVSDKARFDFSALKIPALSFHATEFILYSSETKSSGAEYAVVERYALG